MKRTVRISNEQRNTGWLVEFMEGDKVVTTWNYVNPHRENMEWEIHKWLSKFPETCPTNGLTAPR